MVEDDRAGRIRYRFPPLERRGVIAGWRGGQIATVASSLVVGVLALRWRPSVVGVLVAVVVLALGVALAFWPILGRTGEQWMPLAARWLLARSSGDGRQYAPGPREGQRVSADPDPPVVDQSVDGSAPVPARSRGRSTGFPGRHSRGGSSYRSRTRKAVFGGLSIEALPFGPHGSTFEVGVVLDGRSRTATAVLSVRGHSFALLGPGDQDARIASWARVLSAMAREGTDVHRIQWIESCLPDDGSSVRQHWSRHAVLGGDTPAARSYRALVDESSPVTRRHRVLLALSIHTSRSARSIRASGRGLVGVGAVLNREVLSLHGALEGADISVEGVLGPAALTRAIGESFAPGGRTGAGGFDPGTGDPTGVTFDGGFEGTTDHAGVHPPMDAASSWPWPMTVEPHWDTVRADGTWHATYWIAEWPRVDVTPDFLGPVLFSSLRRTVALIMEPVSPARAARQVAQARTADIADGEMRRRGGFLVTARQTREKEGVEERDAELADGHAQYRFTGYVTLTADTRHELTTARAALEQAAGQSRIELRLLYGEQDVAFACGLPLGRGLS